MRLFGRRRDGAGATVSGAAARSRSKQLSDLLKRLERRAAEAGDAPRVLLHGPPSGRSIETFHALGAKVTVEGEPIPQLPLSYPDGRFDLVVASDVLDHLDDARAGRLAQEWSRILREKGRVLLLARRRKPPIPRFKLDIAPGGILELTACPGPPPRAHTRSNREIHKIVRPLAVDAISLRRDGLREISLKRAKGAETAGG